MANRIMLMWDGRDWYTFPREDWEIILNLVATESKSELSAMIQTNYGMKSIDAKRIAICAHNNAWREL